jgi:predicted transposase YbfD/YdcC
MEGFVACFSGLEDPRASNARRHDLHELLLIALCTFLCGGESCVDMADFAVEKEAFLREFLALPGGFPSHDTFSRVFRQLDPESFRACFQTFMARFAEACHGVVAVDGKSLRRSFDTASARSPLHMVSAWSCEQRLVLGQCATDAKSNEITAIPKLLAMLALNGTIVTIDAMGCQRTIAQQIIDQGGDYALALKDNQATLALDARLFLDDPARTAGPVHTTIDADHGRIETRTATLSHDIGWLQDIHAWPGLAAIGKITRQREFGRKTSTETAYYLLSTPMNPARFAEVARAHWGIENSLHWVLDVTMNEDKARNRLDNGPENLAILRHIALNIITRETTKISRRRKLKKAGWNNEFLRKLILQI